MRILFFAQSRVAAGRDSAALKAEAPLTQPDFWARLIVDFPSLAPLRKTARLARSEAYLQGDELLQPNDEIAILPPVSGLNGDAILLTTGSIARPQDWGVPASRETGALVEFYGMVRETEAAAKIPALHYEAYASMAEKVMREKIAALAAKYPCQAIRIVHRLGAVPTGESAIYVGIQSKHRREGFLFLQEFMDEFKKDVPIWKRS